MESKGSIIALFWIALLHTVHQELRSITKMRFVLSRAHLERVINAFLSSRLDYSCF